MIGPVLTGRELWFSHFHKVSDRRFETFPSLLDIDNRSIWGQFRNGSSHFSIWLRQIGILRHFEGCRDGNGVVLEWVIGEERVLLFIRLMILSIAAWKCDPGPQELSPYRLAKL